MSKKALGVGGANRGQGDDELMKRISDGDLSALGVLFDRYADHVRRVVGRLGVPNGDIDDLVQATFLDAMAKASTYDGRKNAKPWIIGLAVIHVKRQKRWYFRLSARLAKWSMDPVELPEQPDHQAERVRDVDRATKALESLSEKKREVFVLTVLEEMSGEEVAKVLDIPVATVWTRLHHARNELRHLLMEEH